MIRFLCFLLILPFVGLSQSSSNSFANYMKQNWQMVKAINIQDSNEVVYYPAKGIKVWDLGGNYIYSLNGNQLGLVDGVGNVDLGIVDSISANRFIIHVTSQDGYKCLYEYYNITFLKDTLAYNFRKWNYTPNTKERFLHFGYKAVCVSGGKVSRKPTLQQVEKKWGNKITFIFTTVDNKPIAEKEIKVVIPVKGVNMITYVYTDNKGVATNYYKDALFSSNDHITLKIEYDGLRSSAVVSRKNCPIILRRVLRSDLGESGNTDRIKNR